MFVAAYARRSAKQREHDWAKMFAFLGRYANMSPEYLDKQPVVWVHKLANATSEILNEEAEQVRKKQQEGA